MPAAVKTFCIFLIFLILSQVAGVHIENNISLVETGNQQSFYHNNICSADDNCLESTNPDSEMKSVLYSPEKLQLPDALLSPIPSFQFGFIEVLACFLFVVIAFYFFRKVKEKPLFFTNSYFHTLFSSAILINAP